MLASGNKGKFSERIKNIIRFRRRLIKHRDIDKIEILDSRKIYTNYLKVMAVIPEFVHDSLNSNINRKNSNDSAFKSSTNVKFSDESKQIFRSELSNLPPKVKKIHNDEASLKVNATSQLADTISLNKNVYQSSNSVIINNKKENRKKIAAIDVNKIKKNQEQFVISKLSSSTVGESKESNLINVKKSKQCQKLEKKIIDIIKKRLIKTVNELEILQSELYILSEVNGNAKVAVECKKELDRVKDILCKIDKLKEQYDFLRDNYDFEYLFEVDDNDLIDKIIELKDTFGNNELRAVSTDYKLLDVYKYLYLKIDDIEEKTAKFEKTKKEELERLKERDIDFEKLKLEVYDINAVNQRYEYFVKSQSELLHEIDANVSKINSYEQIDYHLKGFGELFRNCFKYFGLLMLSPLKGIIPSIATETLLTGNVVKNLYRNLEWEETRQTIYEAIDYKNMISDAINDLENTNKIVDMTLDDIIHLKMRYNEKFKEYHGDFLEYRDIMQKIGDMENKILGNKIKIEMMRQRALEQKHINDKKLTMVKKLNENKKS